MNIHFMFYKIKKNIFFNVGKLFFLKKINIYFSWNIYFVNKNNQTVNT